MTSDLAIRVAEQLLAGSGYDATALDFIIVATISPDASMPSTAAKVQAAIGATNAFAFDMTAACSGFVFALAMAESKYCIRGLSKRLGYWSRDPV
nr:hypothetical protein [Streptococcus equi]